MLEIRPAGVSFFRTEPVRGHAANGNTRPETSKVHFSSPSSAVPSNYGRLCCEIFRSRAHRPVRPPPFWEFVNGSRDLLFRGVSSRSLSINNLLCGHEDLYFPSDVLCSVAAIFSIYHFSRYSEIRTACLSVQYLHCTCFILIGEATENYGSIWMHLAFLSY